METIINAIGCLALLAGLLFVGAAFCSAFGIGNITILDPPKSPRPAPPKGQRPESEIISNHSTGHGDFPPGFEIEVKK